MITKTIVKEIKEIARDGRFKIAALIVFLLLLVAVIIGYGQYRNTQEQYAAAKTHERNIWLDQGNKNPHSAAHYGTYAFKPKYPLSLLDQGVDKYTGVSIYLEAHKRNEAAYSAAADQTGLSRFGDLTPDFIMLFILPLLIVMLGYNGFTKERENGTYALVQSQGLPGWKLALGKWAGTLMPIVTILTVLFLIAGILLANLDDYGQFEWTSLFAVYGVYLLYYMVFANLVLFVSAISKNSGISLVSGLALWILACFAAPKAASSIADQKYPYPTRQEFATNVLKDKKEGLDGHDPFSQEAKVLEEDLLKEYGVDSVAQLPFNFNGYLMQKGEEHDAAIYFKHYNYLRLQVDKQQSTYRNLAIISPFLPTRFLSMALAHTDYQTHWAFADAAEKHRIAMQAALNGDMADNSRTGDWDYPADPSLWASIPEFEYEPATLTATLNRNTGNLTVLGIWLLISSVLLFVSPKNQMR